jgi:hypothetical protein
MKESSDDHYSNKARSPYDYRGIVVAYSPCGIWRPASLGACAWMAEKA